MTAAPNAWAAWAMAARPATLPAGLTPVALACALAHAEHSLDARVASLAALGALAIQIGTNLFNDWADFFRGADTAERLGPRRVTQQGLIAPRRVLQAACGAFLLAAVCGVGLLAAGGLPILLVGLVSIAAGLLYTGGPYPLAYVGLGDVFVFVFFGLVATCATFALQTGTITPMCYALGAALGLQATAILVVNNLRDRHTDAVAHKRTLAVRLGARFCRLQYAICLALPFVLVLGLWARTPGRPGLLLPWLALPQAVALVRTLGRLDGAALNPMLRRTALHEALFALLAGVGVHL